jgi:c-di-GMP-binding flagellar brake protein YcgR
MQEVEMDADKRKYLRFKVAIPAEFELQGDKEKNIIAKICDFSREGFQIICAETDPSIERESLNFQMRPPYQQGIVNAKADVVWTKKEKGNLCMGLSITEIDPSDKVKILEHAYEQWRRKMQAQHS